MDKLVKERDQIEIYRLQGEMKAVDYLLTLQTEVRNYVKGVQKGTMKNIGETTNAKPV